MTYHSGIRSIGADVKFTFRVKNQGKKTQSKVINKIFNFLCFEKRNDILTIS